jgi:glyoxylase-like metal-dependent hydrolase (beta-lactamase superfamily II)
MKPMAALAALLCATVYSGSLSGQGQDVRHMVTIAPDVYTFTGGGSNSSFVVTPDGVLVFDADIRNDDLPAIRKVTDKKIVYLLSSHASGDHSTGAWHFRADKPLFIATRNQVNSFAVEQKLFDASKAKGVAAYKDAEILPPTMGFDDTLSIHFGGLTFIARAEGYGHTNGDLTVYIPQRGVMFMGDLLNNEIHPGQAEAAGVFFAQVQSWIDLLNRVVARNLPVQTYVPGHGPPHVGRGVADLEEQRDYFIIMRTEVARMIAAGRTLEQIQKEFKVPQRFASYQGANRLTPFLRLYYNQLIETGTVN